MQAQDYDRSGDKRIVERCYCENCVMTNEILISWYLMSRGMFLHALHILANTTPCPVIFFGRVTVHKGNTRKYFQMFDEAFQEALITQLSFLK